MSNKTSDENVGNKIKQQTENTIKYYKNIDNIEEVPIDILRAMYKDILSDYTRQKQINEEHQKINGELREKVKELEKESKILEFQNKQIENYAEELKKYNKTVSDRIVEYKKNSIPKQVVKDKIEEIIRETTPTPVFKPKSMWNNIDYERLYKTQPLLELLEGEK